MAASRRLYSPPIHRTISIQTIEMGTQTSETPLRPRPPSERTVQELAEIAFRDGIKAELIERINGILEEGPIDRLYFTQYVLQ